MIDRERRFDTAYSHIEHSCSSPLLPNVHEGERSIPVSDICHSQTHDLKEAVREIAACGQLSSNLQFY